MVHYPLSPRQLGFANQITFNQIANTSPGCPPQHSPELCCLGKADFSSQASPVSSLWNLRLPGILLWLMRISPTSWWKQAGVQPPRDRFVQIWVKPGLGGVVGRGDPLAQSPPGRFCSVTPNPSWCAFCLYGLPPTSGLRKAALPCASIDLPAPESGCCPG